VNADLWAADFESARLEGADLRGARLGYIDSETTDLKAADLRGASIASGTKISSRNAILPDGSMIGLALLGGESLLVRADVRPELIAAESMAHTSMNIRILEHAAIDRGARLALELSELDWNSTISFSDDIPVRLDGTLELRFDPLVNPQNQIGRRFQLFDWSNVSPMGELTLDSKFTWDTSHLYTTGYVTLLAVPEPSLTPLLQLIAASCLVLHARKRR
jgi:hypothetical protein